MPTLFVILYCATTFLTGCTVMALYYEGRFKRARGDVEWLSGKLYDQQKLVEYWRSEAEIIARDLQALRKQMPKRDPRTNRFVKREPVNG